MGGTGIVGGDPAEMTGGASVLHACGTALQSLESPIGHHGASVADHAGDADLAAAARRFAATFGSVVGETGTQTLAASQLASQAADDLVRTTGGAT